MPPQSLSEVAAELTHGALHETSTGFEFRRKIDGGGVSLKWTDPCG